jgi:hypothetical protein
MRTEYPIVDVTADGIHLVPHQRVDVKRLVSELIPVRDALFELFESRPAKTPVVLQRLEIGLSITPDGRIAFATGGVTRSFTMTFERRASKASTSSRSPKTPASGTSKDAVVRLE